MSAPRGSGNAWWNRTVGGLALTSLLSDLGHEAQSTLLPSFLAALGAPPLALGAVEGISDAAASFVKLGAGWFSDRLRRRKPFVVVGYAATGLASGFIALAGGWPMVLVGKLFGWIGKGVRGPLRDALLARAIPPEARGRAFGFHRAGDTVGAILGPLLALGLLGWGASHGHTGLGWMRVVMAWTLVPGLAAAVVIAWAVPERMREGPAAAHESQPHHAPGAFRRYLTAVGVFGAGDYAHTLLILAAGQLLAPTHGVARAAMMGAGLYVWHNGVYALAAFPAGALADRFGHRRVLALGYAISVAVPLLLIGAFLRGAASLPLMILVFALAGLVNGVQDTLESSAVAGFVPEAERGFGYGLLGAVNGAGDLVSSLLVGALWTVWPTLGFGYAALMMALGAGLMAREGMGGRPGTLGV
ncbi:MAG TPA: MFS transporter [Holophagaceae bacterium]